MTYESAWSYIKRKYLKDQHDEQLEYAIDALNELMALAREKYKWAR